MLNIDSELAIMFTFNHSFTICLKSSLKSKFARLGCVLTMCNSKLDLILCDVLIDSWLWETGCDHNFITGSSSSKGHKAQYNSEEASETWANLGYERPPPQTYLFVVVEICDGVIGFGQFLVSDPRPLLGTIAFDRQMVGSNTFFTLW